MRYLAMAVDYDGTLAHDGRVDEATLGGIERLLATGRKLILVTGRRMEDLATVFDHFDLFTLIVAENGAIVYHPLSRKSTRLAEQPPAAFVEALVAAGVGPIDVGEVIVATWQPHESVVLDTIRNQGLELQVIFNKGAVMVLPAGVNKAFGLQAALDELKLSPHNVVAIGDAENDHAMLAMCECSAAVANAIDSIKERADLVTSGERGQGVVELAEMLVENDLAELEPRLTRHELPLGKDEHEGPATLSAFNTNVLIAGGSGSGKSTVATTLLEGMHDQQYQFLVIDPEGDYESFEGAVTLGSGQQGPSVDEILELLANPKQNVVASLIGVPVADRPLFFLTMLPRLQELRATTGRPHWIVVDEAHHVLPATWQPGHLSLPKELDRAVLITLEPKLVAPGVLERVNHVIVMGETAGELLQEFAETVGKKLPRGGKAKLAAGEALAWRVEKKKGLQKVVVAPSRTERRRHTRKYAEGELPPDRSFYFRGPEGKLNLRAQNLLLFLQMAEGLDDETWQHHLANGDYENWFRGGVKNDELADEAARIAGEGLSPADSRAGIKAAIEERYTAGATPPLPMAGTDAAGRFQGEEAEK